MEPHQGLRLVPEPLKPRERRNSIMARLKQRRWKRIFLQTILMMVVVAIAGLSVTLGVRRSMQKRIAEAIKIAVPPGIDSLERVTLGGVNQWILIRGHDASDEVLLFIHGGPGVPNMPLCHLNADLEKRFVVVQWDQRGAGKSYSTSALPEAMKIDQFVSDARALTQLLIERFDKDKIYLLGHSWGSVVGAKTEARYPELFNAYIGVSQVTNVLETQKLLYERTLETAKSVNNASAVADLEAIGAPPFARPDDHLLACEWLAKFQDRSVVAIWRLVGEMASSPYYSIGDMNRFRKGMRFSLDYLWETLGNVNLFEEIPSFEIPVVFIQGHEDLLIPGELIDRYSSSLIAPRGKQLIWLEGAGHMPDFKEPDGFQNAV